ncbi:hypothetical protein D3C80_1943230 [compost metagenome]
MKTAAAPHVHILENESWIWNEIPGGTQEKNWVQAKSEDRYLMWAAAEEMDDPVSATYMIKSFGARRQSFRGFAAGIFSKRRVTHGCIQALPE